MSLRSAGPYQLQAAIAACHADAPRYDETAWGDIVSLYTRLSEFTPSPVVALNRAVAVSMARGAEEGLRAMSDLASDLDAYYLFHSARADMLRRLGRNDEAAEAYRRARDSSPGGAERAFLDRRLAILGGA
jgi:RNA polymerase sigma-70 factor, ECF subfamily